MQPNKLLFKIFAFIKVLKLVIRKCSNYKNIYEIIFHFITIRLI